MIDITFILAPSWTVALAIVCLSAAGLTLVGLRVMRRVPRAKVATPWEYFGTVFYGIMFGLTLLWAAFFEGDSRIIRSVFRFELWGAFLMASTSSILAIWSAWREGRNAD